MEVMLDLCNRNRLELEGCTIVLPTEEERLLNTLDELSIGTYDDIIIKNYKSKMSIDFTIYTGNNLCDVNNSIDELNQYADDSVIIALSEVFNYLDDMVPIVRKGIYEFYPDKTLTDLAYMFSDDSRYSYSYSNNDIYNIVDLMRLQGYIEVSTGVILITEVTNQNRI